MNGVGGRWQVAGGRYHIGRIANCIVRSASHISYLTSHASRLTPHVSRFTFYVLHFTLPLLFLIFLFSTPLQAQSPESLVEVMAVANQSYQTGDYEAAIQTYETLVESGIQHSAVYYNLGNAYFKQGDLGQSILNYRRAQLLSPRDNDIAINLTIARAQTVDRLDLNDSQPGLGQIVGSWFTLNEMALLLLALWLLICILICFMIILPRWRKLWAWLTVSCVVLLLVGLAAVVSNLYGTQQFPEAVVVAETVDVTDVPAPLDEAVTQFTLHAGAEVQIIERRLGWRRIALPGDLVGWVPSETLALIEIPQS